MKIIYGLSKVKKFKRPVVAMGVFDGVHLGHRKILAQAVVKAHTIKGTSIALTFWPHPQKEDSLSSLDHRLRLISSLGIEVSIVINFDRRFAQIKASDFVKDIIFKKLGTSYLYVGRNFRFGKDAQGDCKALKDLAKVYNFKLKAFKVVRIDNRTISSTYIRRLIKKGRLSLAKKLLAREVSILGTVTKGSFLARRLGFPTANVNPHHEIIPPSGIYAVGVILNKKKFGGTCYIGTNPTLNTSKALHTEVHLFNFKKNIYGKNLEVRFIKKIREEAKFASRPLLIAQIQKDIQAAKKIFSRH